MQTEYHSIIAGAGIAGLAAALELMRTTDAKVLIIDRDTQARVGGLARWSFGGMALCGTDEQAKQKIPDSPARLFNDWQRFADFNDDDHWPKAWAQCYAEENNRTVYRWLKSLGCRFLPAVNWVERGLYGEGNSLPRYHVLWGTGWELVERLMAHLLPYINQQRLTMLYQQKVVDLLQKDGRVIGVNVLNERTDEQQQLYAANIIIASGGINGSLEKVKAHWDSRIMPCPSSMLNGASPLSDGELHACVAGYGGKITRESHMWNYAAGIRHPQPEFPEHGLSLIPCKSALWLDHQGRRIGPMPLVTGFDTHDLCKQVVNQDKPWTWQVMNKKIALKELAVSGSAHNPSIRDKKLVSFLKEIFFGNHRLFNQLKNDASDFVVANTLEELVFKMNALSGSPDIDLKQLSDTITAYDSQLQRGIQLSNDDQIRRIVHCRQWKPDKLRTCYPAPIMAKKSAPLVAIRLQLITRKSLGGLQTNLAGQVLKDNGEPMTGLYAIGEAAGFGGGGACGKRSLEGTFLSACILTARKTAQAISQL